MSNDIEATDRLFKLQAKINMMVVDGGRDATTVADALQQILEEKQRRLATLTSVKAAKSTINPYKLFSHGAGLWTSSNFDNFILSGASKENVSANETNIGYANLVQAANDVEIGGEMPKGYVFEDVNIFLVHLATFIEGQWGGKSGTLLNNGYANIFYVKVNSKVFAVIVHWRADSREWHCYANRLDDVRWHTGHRAFSATQPF